MGKKHNWRQTGGAAGKRGARYEDYFASFKLVAFTPTHLDRNRDMRMKEQTGYTVDDFLICGARDEYYQLKDAQHVSWNARNRKLAREFQAQKRTCQRPTYRRRYRLVLVVSDAHLQQQLRRTMPPSLRGVTSVQHFPRVARPRDLALPHSLLETILRDIAADSQPGLPELENIAIYFHAAWINHVPDRNGFCVYSDALAFVRTRRGARIRKPFVAPAGWAQAQAILAVIPGFSYDVSRGYFEWAYAPTDRGTLLDPCDSPNFARFVQRVIDTGPATFDDLEVQLP